MLGKRLVSKLFQRTFMLTAAAFGLTLGVLLAFFHQMGLFVISRVPVVIAMDSGSTTDVYAGSGLKERMETAVKPLTGKKIWEIDMSKLQASIARDEWVKDVLISRSFPSAMKIRITQKTPVLIMIGPQGEFLPVTEDAEVMSAVPAGALPDVPILRSEGLSDNVRAAPIETGPPGEKPTPKSVASLNSKLSTKAESRNKQRVLNEAKLAALDAAHLAQVNAQALSREQTLRRARVVKFVMGLPEKGVLTRRNISEITWNNEDGISLTLVQPRVEVKLGDERPELKILRVTQVLNYLAAHHLKERVIDASFSKKVLVRLRKGP